MKSVQRTRKLRYVVKINQSNFDLEVDVAIGKTYQDWKRHDVGTIKGETLVGEKSSKLVIL